MARRKLGKKFSFSTRKHIETVVSSGAECTDLHLSKEELLRMIGAAVNSINATPDATQFMILCWKKRNSHQCIIYPM